MRVKSAEMGGRGHRSFQIHVSWLMCHFIREKKRLPFWCIFKRCHTSVAFLDFYLETMVRASLCSLCWIT